MSKARSRKGSSGPDSGDTDMEVFPDLHHKMSKKIAQLTKVIYHLNTKNEDHQSMMEAISYQHKVELDGVAKDAISRMTSAKELAEIKQKLQLKESSIEKLIKKHQAEKDKTVADFDKFKTTMSNKEATLQQEFEEKYEKLANDFERINKEFKNRISLFEKTNNKLQHDLTDALASGGDAAVQLKKQHEQEMERAIVEANSKYNDMLMDQLSQQETLKQEYEDKLAALRRELEAAAKLSLQSVLEKELGQLRATLQGEKEHALLTLKREEQDKLNKMREDLSTKLERCISDLGIKNDAYATLQGEKRELDRQLQEQLAAMEARLGNELGSADQKLQNALIEAAQLKKEVVQLNANIQEHEENIARLEELIKRKNSEIMKLEDVLKEKDTELQQLVAQLASGDNATSTLRTTVTSLESQIKELLGAKDTLHAQVREAELSLKSSHSESKTLLGRVHALEKTVDTLTQEKKALQGQIDVLNKDSSTMNTALQQELTSLRAKLTLQENTFLEEKEVLKGVHAGQVDELKKAALKEKKIDMECIATLKDDIHNKQKEIEESRRVHMEELKSLQSSHVEALQALAKKHQEEVTPLKVTITQLENEVQRLMEANDNSTAAISKDLVKIQEKYKLLKGEYESKKREGEVAQSTITGLKQQIDDLREELKSTQRAYKEKMDMSLQKLEEVWLAKMELLSQEHEEEKSKISSDLQTIWDKEKAVLVEEKDGEISSLKRQLSDDKQTWTNRLYVLERDKLLVDQTLTKEKEERAGEISAMTTSHAAAMRDMHEQHTEALEALRQELTNASESSTSELLLEHNQALQGLRDQLESVVTQSELDLAAGIEKTRKEGVVVLESAIKSRESELHREHTNAVETHKAGHEARVTTLQEEHGDVTAAMQTELNRLKEEVGQKADQNATLVSLLSTEKDERDKDSQVALHTLQEAERGGEMSLRQEKERSQNALNEQQERFLAEMKLLKSEFQEDRRALEEAIQGANVEYAILEERYQNRESRPDDVLRIQELETIITNQEEEVKRTREEMLYLKRELQNREESYNLKFNVKPNVGVMNVLKTPQTDPGAGSSKGANGGQRSTKGSSKMGGNKPRHVVGGNGGAMGMPGLGGLGGVGGGGGLVGSSQGGAPPLPGPGKMAPAPIPGNSRESNRMR